MVKDEGMGYLQSVTFVDHRVLSIIVGNGLDDKIALEGLGSSIVIVCPPWVGPMGYIMGIYAECAGSLDRYVLLPWVGPVGYIMGTFAICAG
ncbi:hypothetical protein OROMI_011320 [Orobanche minor]